MVEFNGTPYDLNQSLNLEMCQLTLVKCVLMMVFILMCVAEQQGCSDVTDRFRGRDLPAVQSSLLIQQ